MTLDWPDRPTFTEAPELGHGENNEVTTVARVCSKGEERYRIYTRYGLVCRVAVPKETDGGGEEVWY